MKEADGTESVSRGCYKLEEHKLFLCNKEDNQDAEHKERHARGLGGVQYSVECCQADFCNVGPYPVLQDYSTSKIICLCIHINIQKYIFQNIQGIICN